MNEMNNKGMDRRRFLKTLGMGVAATTISGCSSESDKKNDTSVSPEKMTGGMTYRKSLTGDNVSLLGYGCMRWPMIKDDNGKEVAMKNLSRG